MVLNFGSKRIGVAFQNRLDGFTACGLMLLVVHAVGAIARVAVPARRKAFTVEL